MPATQAPAKRRGRVRWSGPYSQSKGTTETAQRFPRLFQQRQLRPSRIHISQVAEESCAEETAQRRCNRLPNLANLRERRPFRRFSQAPKAALVANLADSGRSNDSRERQSQQDMLAADSQRNGGQADDGSLSRASTQSRRTTASRTTAKDSITGSASTIPQEKPVAASHGVSASIHLAEPMLFLQGFEFTDSNSSHNTAMLRGSLHVKVTKTAKLKAISLKFRGRATTHWPEGMSLFV